MGTKIKTISLGHKNNAEVDNFFFMCLNFIREYVVLKLNITQAMVDAFSSNYDILHDLIKRQLASAITPLLATLDTERDTLLSYFFAAVKNAAKSPIAAHRAAYAALAPVIKPYEGIADHPVAQETSEISGLLLDANKTGLAVHLNALGLTDVLESLDSINAQYIALELQRTAEMPSKAETDKWRRLTYESYTAIIDRVNASLILEPTPEMESFAVKINNQIKHTNDAFNLRMGIAHANRPQTAAAAKTKKTE